jgi:hypothetical protein
MTAVYPDRLSATRAHLASRTDCACGDLGCPYSTSDIEWALEEIDHLRHYLEVLGEPAYALEALRWALEDPAPGRPERCRRAVEEARQTLLDTPNWRDGECEGGCRRYATHVFVTERDGGTGREACCEECGSLWLRARRTAIEAGWHAPATVGLEPIAQQHDQATGVLQ